MEKKRVKAGRGIVIIILILAFFVGMTSLGYATRNEQPVSWQEAYDDSPAWYKAVWNALEVEHD